MWLTELEAGSGTVSNEMLVNEGSEVGIGRWEMNKEASVAAAPAFAAVSQSGMGASGLARLNDEGEGSSIMKQLSVRCMPQEKEGGRLDGVNTCWMRDASVSNDPGCHCFTAHQFVLDRYCE